MEPALGVDGFGSCLFISPVALHDTAATDQKFLLLANFHFKSRQWLANALRAIVFLAVDADDNAANLGIAASF